MQSYFFDATDRQQNLLRSAQISFAPFQIGRQKGIVLEDAHLPQTLTALNSTVERSEKSQYEGIQVLHLKPARKGAARAASATPATVTVGNWPSWAGSVNRDRFKGVVEEFASSFGVREVYLSGNDDRRTPPTPQKDNSKFAIWVWAAAQGSAGDATSADKLWGHRISSGRGNWTIWQPSGLGIIIADDCGEPVAELVGNNLYVLYCINSSDLNKDAGIAIFRRVVEEAALLHGATPEEMKKRNLTLQQQREEKLLAEAKANPVTVETWEGNRTTRDKFAAVAKDFVEAFGGKQIRLYDCRANRYNPKTDGRMHIFVWSSPYDIAGGGTMEKTLFGAPLKWDYAKEILKASVVKKDQGVLFTDDEGYEIGEMVGDNIYILYPLCHGDINLKWDGNGADALFRRILEEAVFIRTATPEQKAARARAAAEKRRVQSREEYVKACNGRFDAVIKESKKAVDSNPQKVRELQQSIVSLIRETVEATKKLQEMESSRAEAVAAYAREFDKLLTIPKVVDVRVAGNTVKVFTETLYCVNPRTKKRHEIGAFRIEMSLAGGVFWFNLTRKVDGFERSMQAPHVFVTGKACLGNMEEVIPQLVANYEFAALAMVAINFVESVNVDDPAGKYIINWPVAA